MARAERESEQRTRRDKRHPGHPDQHPQRHAGELRQRECPQPHAAPAKTSPIAQVPVQPLFPHAQPRTQRGPQAQAADRP